MKLNIQIDKEAHLTPLMSCTKKLGFKFTNSPVSALNQISDLSMTPEQVTTSSCTHEHYCIIDERHTEVANSAKNSKHKITFDKITLKPNQKRLPKIEYIVCTKIISPLLQR